jgi:hypothetical protein
MKRGDRPWASRFGKTPRRLHRWLAAGALVASTAAAGKAAPPQAQTPEQPVDANREAPIAGASARFLFEIEAGPLRTVLAQFERVSGWQVSAADDEIEPQAPGVGQFSAEALYRGNSAASASVTS